MKKDITVLAEPRESRGKNEARRMRVAGKVPAVVYGLGTDPAPVAVSPKDIHKVVHSSSGLNTIFNLQLTTETVPVMVIDQQFDPIKSSLLHLDLKRIDLTRKLTVKVPVLTSGDPRGVKEQGGILDIAHREVEIEALPDDVPDAFRLDIRPLQLNQAIRASDLEMTGSMKLKSPADQLLVHVLAPKGADAAAEATKEPEVAKKGKEAKEAKKK